MKGFGKVGERLRPWKATRTGGGGDDPPEPIERASQDEPGEDEWQVEFLENEIRLSRIHMVARIHLSTDLLIFMYGSMYLSSAAPAAKSELGFQIPDLESAAPSTKAELDPRASGPALLHTLKFDDPLHGVRLSQCSSCQFSTSLSQTMPFSSSGAISETRTWSNSSNRMPGGRSRRPGIGVFGVSVGFGAGNCKYSTIRERR